MRAIEEEPPDDVLAEQGIPPASSNGHRRPPEAGDVYAEEAVAGACIISTVAVADALAIGLTGAAFVTGRPRAIFEAAVRAAAQGGVDHRLVWQEVVGAGNQAGVTEADLMDLAARAPGTGNTTIYAEKIRRRHVDRLGAALGRQVTAAYEDGDGADVEQALAELNQLRTTRTDGLFRRYSAAELAAQDLTLDWLIRGVLCSPTYGQIAGSMKSLKSHVADLTAVALASGLPLLDRFHIDQARPVLMYVGEGGRIPHTRRLTRVAEALDLKLADLPIELVYDVAPVASDRFRRSLARDLAALEPGLFILDPLYAYHGAGTNSANLHEEGALLSGLSSTCVDAGAALLIVNHWNQTGNGRGLGRITQAGSGEWVDTWMLTSHRDTPTPADIAVGRFKLLLELGCRQWGGTSWNLDLEVGRLDPDLGIHDGPLAWTISPADTAGPDDQVDRAVDIVTEHPGEYGKEDLAKRLGGRLTDARRTVDAAERSGRIHTALTPAIRGDGKPYKPWRYYATSPARTDQDDTEPGAD